MRIRLTKVDELQFLTCLKHRVWGSKAARFKDWKVGDYLAFIVDKAIAGLGEVSDKPFYSKQRVWDNGVFPHRIPINFVHLMSPDNRPPILGEIRDAFTSTWGTKYGWGILNQQVLSGEPAEKIIKVIRSRLNDLAEIQAKLDHYLAEAKQKREKMTKPNRKPGRPRKAEIELRYEEKQIGSKVDESIHTRAQSALIKIGKITGCSVWIASNDRTRKYQGKGLGEACLKVLPSLGLSQEATKRISLIEVIWIRNNAPYSAFEVETTTSVYSGLLRMSDLLSEVPALKIQLFVVAPRDRQSKVFGELSRPTFQKIGLSEFCKFIAAEDLDSLLSKVENFEGHVQPSIIDTVAVELEDGLQSALE